MEPHSSTNRLLVVARQELLDRELRAGDPAVLLEGSWPEGISSERRRSLDDEIDARFAWIDEETSRLAERLGKSPFLTSRQDTSCCAVNPAWLDALALRYYVSKLIRLVAYFTEAWPLRAGTHIELIAERGRDEDYAHCAAELCRLAGASCQVRWVDGPKRPAPEFPPNSRWRRAMARLAGLVAPRLSASCPRTRVVLCGNPSFLDPICRELLRRRARVWWLYDRFALRGWLRWRTSGVGQLVCQSSEASSNRLLCGLPQRLDFHGVDLAGPVNRWMAERVRTYGPRQTRILQRIDAHFRRVRPTALVVDEDATPMARAAVAIARRHGATSFVVQHGAPVCRFGFAPAAADQILLWGRSSQKQLTEWGVPIERIRLVGSPRHEPPHKERSHSKASGSRKRTICPRKSPSPRVLLLATTPPRDDRPDAIALHFTRCTYAEMLRTALAAVSGVPGARLIVKLHPRAPQDPIALAVLSEFPSLASRVVRRGPVEKWIRRADCVLSCFSSAGIDATLSGVPVIQLLPSASGEILPHQEWGMLGTARSQDEIEPLLMQALRNVGWVERSETHADLVKACNAGPNPNVFADLGPAAAARIAEAVLAPLEPVGEGGTGVEPAPGPAQIAASLVPSDVMC
jgi:hypothetical protein